MAKINIHAGDFEKGKGMVFVVGQLIRLYPPKSPWKFSWSSYGRPENFVGLAQIDVIREDFVKHFAGTLGWGMIGGLAAGSAGFLVGSLVGGNAMDVTFAAEFKDGRRMLATTDTKTYKKMLEMAF